LLIKYPTVLATLVSCCFVFSQNCEEEEEEEEEKKNSFI